MAGRQPRILHLTTVDMSLALLLLPQLVAFQEAGYEVIGVSADGPWVGQLEEAGIEHVALQHSTRAMAPLADVRAAGEFYRLCRRLSPDIVHTHNPKPGWYGRIMARLARVPVVVNTVHGLYAQPDDPPTRRWPVYALERIAAAFSDGELLQNPEDRPVMRRLGVPEHKLHHLGNGIDLTRFDPSRFDTDRRARVREELGVGPDEVVVGLVGRLVVEKGYRQVFDAVRRLQDRDVAARVVVVGPHEPNKGDALGRDEIASAEALGVTFLGLRSDVEELYTAFDVYVLASHREGFPRSAMEAAAMGLPVIATDVRGCRQVVDHGETGLLVPVRDAGALAEAIERVVSDDELRSRMGAAGRRKALAEFDDRQQVATTVTLYEKLLGARRR